MIMSDLRHGFHAALSNISANASQSVATIILGIVAPSIAVAQFGAALIITTAAKQVLFPISQVVFAHSISRQATESITIKGSKHRTYLVIFFLGLATWIAIYLAAAFVVPMVFGSKFDISIPVLKLMSPIPLVFITGQTVALEFLFAKNLGKLVSRATVSGTAVCIIASIAMGKTQHAMGIATSILMGECVATFLIIVFSVAASHSNSTHTKPKSKAQL